MGKWLAVAAFATLVTGCKFGGNAFVCTEDTACGPGGVCEKSVGSCSFADPSCTGSMRRYGDQSGDRSGTCVGSTASGSDAGAEQFPDPTVCYGSATGPVRICLATAPTTPRAFAAPTTINTDDAGMCSTTMSGATGYCVIAATDITINARLRAQGSKPLVLLASGSITSVAAGLIDVGSHRIHPGEAEQGAGSDPSPTCGAGTPPGNNGGGAGGSFFGLGGAGGPNNGGTAAPVVTAVTAVRGGCAGQDGSGNANDRGNRGHGGGAVYLLAGTQIDLAGGINAAGEGGSGANRAQSGGGGGGAGGMIGLEAPMITVTSLLLANGGAGGEGSGQGTPGNDGADSTTVNASIGGNGGTGNGGDGGNGSAGGAAAGGGNGNAGVAGQGGSGGGGGGVGLIKAPATATLGAMVSPSATP